MSRNRNLTIFVVLALVVLAAAGGWIAGANIVSPAEAAARTAPPTPSPILVPVEERVLASDIVTRGTARFGLPQAISIVPSTLKAEVVIITSLPERGRQFQEGEAPLTISGRPVFILQGDVPAFRDLVPGLVGGDVQQLEAALQRLGFDPGAVDEVYDEQTSAAVADWYQSAGWQPFAPTDAQLAEIARLEDELAQAQNAQAAAQEAVELSALALTAARAEADRVKLITAADVQAKTLRRDQATDSERAAAETELAAAQSAAAASELQGAVTIQTAINARQDAERELARLTERVGQLTAELDDARSTTGVAVPADEIVFLPSVPVRIDQLDVMIGVVASGALLTVTNNQLAIDSSLPLDEARLVQLGMPVTIDEPSLGITATGIVSQVADVPGTSGVDGFHVYFEIAVDETPYELEGFSLRLTIPVETTGGAVTAVPISALSLAADGTSRVQVDHDGTLEFVTVKPGLTADGFVEVNSVDGTLMPGQFVLIGFE